MKNRILMVVSAVMAVGCGGGTQGQKPWDKNKDGLVEACEGLTRDYCGSTPGCHGEEPVCAAVCAPDAKGGCGSPCTGDFQCVPDRCEDLAPAQCATDARCVLETATCDIACTGLGCPRCAGQVCKPRSTSCSDHTMDACLIDPNCTLQVVTVCEAHDAARPADPIAPPPPGCGGGCIDQIVCVPKAVDVCSNRDPSLCAIDGACRLEVWACPAICEDDGKGGCKPCDAPPPTCVPTGSGGGVSPPPEVR